MALMEKALWYCHRISAMSAPEILHRAVEVIKRRHDHYHSRAFVPTPRDRGIIPPIPGLREGLSNWQVPASLIADWEARYEEARTGHFFLLGQHWPECAPDKKWHLDPVTGTFWPHDRYCYSIDFRHARNIGDVKYVWELSRLQYLQPIAALAFQRKDAALAAFCLGELESWIDHNPPHLGVHWVSGIELAMRAVSIFVVTTLVGEHLTMAQRTKVWGTLEAHGQWLERYPSKYSSANNHLTAEGMGLFIIGSLCTTLPRAARWKKHGWDILCKTLRTQILADGVGAEQTMNYTAVVLEMLLLGWHIAKTTQVRLPDYYMQRIVAAGECLRWFTDAGGNCPRIGDDDNARVLGAYRHDETYVRSILGSIATIAGRPDLAPPGEEPYMRQALFGFPTHNAPGPTGVRSFDDGGYTVGRHTINAHEILLAMDHGYLGFLSIAAHGHADALSLWLHIDDQPVLIDSGTYLYHSGGVWRTHFRSTAAHNTLVLEKTNSSTMSGNFNWSHKANAILNGCEVGNDHWWIEGEHDGYKKKFNAIHRRRLNVTPSSGFSVEDILIAGKPHAVEIGFLIHPSLVAVRNGTVIDIRKGDKTYLSLYHEGPLTLTIGHPDTPDCGWYSPTFGEKQATTRIIFSGVLLPEQKAITHFSYTSIVGH